MPHPFLVLLVGVLLAISGLTALFGPAALVVGGLVIAGAGAVYVDW